jgi:hypothetical protein
MTRGKKRKRALRMCSAKVGHLRNSKNEPVFKIR